MSFGAVAVGVGSAVAGAAVSSALAPSGGSGGQAGAAAADPFASQRPQYQTQLQTLMQGGDPASKMLQPGYQFNTSDPSYAWRLNQGLDAVNAKAAAGGMLNSGNRLTALNDYAQGAASQEFSAEYQRQEADYSNQFSRLAQLSGANVGSPAAAGQIIAGANQQAQAGASALGNAVSGAVQQGAGYFMNGSTPANGTGTTYGGEGSVTPYNFSSGVSDPSYGVGSGGYSFFGYGG